MRRVVVLAALLALVSGCGKSGLTKKEYAKRANAICSRYADRIKVVPTSEPRRYLRRIEGLIAGQIRELARLEPSGDARADARRALQLQRRLLAGFRRLEPEIARLMTNPTDREAAAKVQREFGAAQTELGKLNARLGLTECATS